MALPSIVKGFMEIKTHDDFKKVFKQVMLYIYDTIPPNNPCMITMCYTDGLTAWTAYDHTTCITKEFGMLMIADTLLGLNYHFGDLDLSTTKKIFDTQLNVFSDRMDKINQIPGLRYVIRAAKDKSSFVVLSNLDEKDNVKYLELFKQETKKTGG